MTPAPASPGPVLQVDGLEVTFPTAAGDVAAVRGVSWSVAPGEVLALVGESGSGKTTVAMAVMGLLPRRARVWGSVRLAGRELLGATTRALDDVRGSELTMVFQDPMGALNPVHRVGAQVAEVVRAHERVSRREAWRRAVQALDVVGLPQAAARARSYPHQLSGGMRQRVGIAMAMVAGPSVLLADEPTTALDVTVQDQVLDALRRAQEATGVAVVLITHDLGVVAGTADRVMVMYAGRVVEHAGVDELFASPRMPYTRGLLAALPRIDADGPVRLAPIPGSPPAPHWHEGGCPFVPRCPWAAVQCRDQEPVLEDHGRPGHPVACHRVAEIEAEPGG